MLKSLIDLLGARTSEEWLYRDDVPADALLLDIDNPDAVATWKTKPETVRRNTIAYSKDEHNFSIARRLAKPLRAAELIAVLKDIEQTADSTPAPAAPSEMKTLAECAARHSDGAMRLACGDHEVVLDRNRQQFCSSEHGDALAALLTHPFSEYQITYGTAAEVPADSSVKWQDPKALLWLIGQCGSHGRLISDIDRGGQFRISRWPGFGAVRPSHKVLSLCSLLTRNNAMGIDEIRSVSGFPEFDVVAFLNAAFLTGILVVQRGDAHKPENEAAKPEVSTERKGLLAKIRSRLAHPRT